MLAVVTSDYITVDQIRTYCLIGGAAGSLAYILQQKLFEHEGVVAVFLCNLLLSSIFSPYLCGRLPQSGIAITYDSCLALSGAVALAVPWLFSQVIPALGKKAVASVKSMNMKEAAKRFFNLKDRSDG